jgi:predicted flap endonuclease-1-like 5' DNA nuclease
MFKTARNATVLGVGLSISAIVGWLLLKEKKHTEESASMIIKSQLRPTEPPDTPKIVLPMDALVSDNGTEAAVPAGETQDDLTRIKDIGPRFAAALNAIGITRFAQLAAETPETLADRLSAEVSVRAERIQTNNWIGQAATLAQS